MKFMEVRAGFPPVWAQKRTKRFENFLYFMAVSPQGRSPHPRVGSELVNWLRNENVSQKNLDRIAEHDWMQGGGQALEGQRGDRWYFTLLTAVQLLPAAGGAEGRTKPSSSRSMAGETLQREMFAPGLPTWPSPCCRMFPWAHAQCGV